MRRLSILLVDSEVLAYEKLQRVVGDQFTVQSVASLREARQALEAAPPDILVLEVHLRSEDGLELCRYVRARSSLSYLPILLLSSFSTLQDKVAGFDAGADDYVVKPFDGLHLLARIRLLLRIKRLERRTHV
ncbi:response regulator receiver protein [Ktedonobacter racemifer DSM 44963]|uniref:Response regulator receiver protein n=1 Tax=Ktedonobacter racemifer DSM 44963 TaxID=485913 RepID=D6TIY9_KTERA|nr:response regulator receiver protein [Ktedonobacter racemifer DSM 44963]